MDKKPTTPTNLDKQRSPRRKPPPSPTITPPTKSDRALLRRILNAGPDPDKHPRHPKPNADDRTAKPKPAEQATGVNGAPNDSR